jgi:hypothetical protein
MDYRESKYSNLRNGNYEWPSEFMDSKELFEENCKEYPNSKTLKYYKENPIEYSFNNYGFRTPDDFNDTDEGNVFIGCSHTMGVGHPLENTWSYKLNKHIGGKFWNLSQGGCGSQTDYRLLFAWKDTLKIKNIFHYTVPWPRYEFHNEKELVHLTHYKNKENQHRWEFFIDILVGEEYCNYNQIVNINAIKGLSHDIGCNYYYLTNKIFDEFNQNDNSFRARDLRHYTVDQQNFLYEKFLKVWENDNGI